jgi:diguanylate cyclase (GGDEF)-like protein
MANEREAQVQREMAKLRSDFHARLTTDLEEFLDHSKVLEEERVNTESLRVLYENSHRLAGSALTFGYQETGEILREIESALDAVLNEEVSFDIAKLRQLFSELSPALATSAEPFKSSSPQSLDNESVDEKAQRVLRAHIYVLEDDPSTSQTLKLGLSSFGYQVSTFVDIQTMVERALQEHPDGLIVDTEYSSFADQNLAAAARKMREHGMENIPIFVVSEHENFNEKLAAARNGVVAFLGKPVNIPSLESSLEYVLEQRSRSPFRVLLVDDDEFSMNHHRLMLEKWGMVAHGITDPSNVLSCIEDFHPDLMIFDLNMPNCTGIELAEVVRYHTHWIHIPIIFLSSERNESRQVRALKTGGDDFIVKPVIEEHFVSTIMGRARRARLLAEMMTKDSLTGLLKHTEIKERLNHEYARARRNKSLLSVAMIDIDRFKLVNDTYGHQTGDIVISTLAHFLRRGLRTTDIVGRYGGEEYMVVLPDTSAENALRKLDQLRTEFETVKFRHNDKEFTCSFSGGVCESSLVSTIDDFVERADMALYQAKERGRDQIVNAGETD